MKAQGWYEEDSELLSRGKFIALEVSDHEDDYNSSDDDAEPGNLQTMTAISETSSVAPSTVRTPEPAGPVGSGSKRWSILSNSSKKRWSSLSFTSEERRLSPAATSASRKRRSTASDDKSKRMIVDDSTGQLAQGNSHTSTADAKSAGSHSGSTSRRVSVSSSMSNLNRSSTSTSLRQMFGKIGLQDEEKENSKSASRGSIVGKGAPRRNTARATLGELDTNVFASLSHRKSFADNASVVSGRSMSSTSSASSGSKWKFWKRNSDVFDPYSPSISGSPQQLHSNASLKSRRSQSSLKQKNSHSSLNKLISHRNSVTSESISLPIPDQVSRDKLRTKLRNSTSIMSMNSAMAKDDLYEFQMSQLLKLCDQTEMIAMEKLFPEWSKMTKISKHVYRWQDSVYKFLPLGQDEFTHTKNVRLKELELLKLMSGTPGFTQMKSCHLALIRKEPYLICELKYAGVPLKKAKIKDWSTVVNILWQCAVIIYAAETKYQFEHRDLQLDHILVDSNNNVTLCDYKLARAFDGTTVHYTRLDHPLFFQGRGDYRYEVYNTMRHWCTEGWSHFDPRNNLLWLHYLGVKLIEKHRAMPHDAHYSELLNLVAQVNPHRRRRAIFRRSDQILSCGDLLRLKR
ncbi:LADA_0G04544g1_1 [Lachancea dasiensis]|uniref:non-specific serine/threonine protein kinase n=1 Tax=Lachancea dasiensis TaxID=1072105 RepID=A0A1G4JS97_9SACH|nr:LADA_0G04544g1_1 [Lachancea dasiensis]